MRRLKLVGLSADGHQVVYCDDVGAEFTAPADDRLRAALRGDRARLGQLEIEMESALRPRDIQGRIRAGEAPELVASIAGVSIEKIMPYCVPVLAERQHVAELAGRSHVRRKNAESPARRLTDVVAERLRGRSIDPASAEWDAWRRDDGRWTVQASYHSGERERSATFIFDAVGRYSIADDDEAKWLTGERQATVKGPQPRETGRPAERRLSSVPPADDLLTLSEAADDVDDSAADLTETAPVPAFDEYAAESHDIDSYADEDFDVEVSDDLTAVVRAVREADATSSPPERADETAGVEHDGLVSSDPVTEPTPERRRRSARRASVPSWDEIMLGRRGER